MNGHSFTLAGAALTALGSGALWWADRGLLCVSDLHFGKAARQARLGGAALPPYEVRDTLARLDRDIATTGARAVLCLGDSFDDMHTAAALPEAERLWLTQLQAGRRWYWIEGNHDPGPMDLGGSHLAEHRDGPIVFRHVAQTEPRAGPEAEISGHYHPKAGLRGLTRPAFLIDRARVILPAYGTYTGGLRCTDPVLAALMAPDAVTVLTGARARPMPMHPPRRKTA